MLTDAIPAVDPCHIWMSDQPIMLGVVTGPDQIGFEAEIGTYDGVLHLVFHPDHVAISREENLFGF